MATYIYKAREFHFQPQLREIRVGWSPATRHSSWCGPTKMAQKPSSLYANQDSSTMVVMCEYHYTEYKQHQMKKFLISQDVGLST